MARSTTPRTIDKTFGCLLREQAKKRLSSLLVTSDHQKRSLTYAQANNRSDQLAKGLASPGAKKGDRVAILMGNDVEYVEVFFCLHKTRSANYASQLCIYGTGTALSLIVMQRVHSIHGFHHLIEIITLHGYLVLKLGIPSLRHIIITNGERLRDHHLGYETVMESGLAYELDLLALDKKNTPRDIMNLQFTSGSTVMDKICLPVPLFHSFGLIISLATVAVHGASLTLPDYKFNMEATLACIPKYKSGSAVPEALAWQVWAAFGITQTHTNWGLTESSSICTMTRDTDNMYQRTTTSRSLFPGVSARVVDLASRLSVPRGKPGEIALRGFGIQQEYFANPKKTAEAHQILPEDGLEWFLTGDEGYVDKDGYFVITGRIKDMIIRGGENISPLEIEERLVAHPAIAQSTVISVSDQKYGEQICAFIERSSVATGVTPSDDDLRAWVRETFAHFKAPKYVVWLGSRREFREWPKSGSGKLRKPDLRKVAPRLLMLYSEQPRL
ncbi:hypothetical protein F5Y09DRAFT_334973 [Xylaria sp. FL1042]|nr:hypothetical protein F5Y09DRAFT_334973 [Xylaria sp. FL1042]